LLEVESFFENLIFLLQIFSIIVEIPCAAVPPNVRSIATPKQLGGAFELLQNFSLYFFAKSRSKKFRLLTSDLPGYIYDFLQSLDALGCVVEEPIRNTQTHRQTDKSSNFV